MYHEAIVIEEKERKLTSYLESSTTEEVFIEAQIHIPSLRTQSHTFYKLNQLKLPQSVKNTLIYYVLATGLATQKLLKLASLCEKYNINSAQAAINFFKKHYVIRSQMAGEY